MFGTVCHRDDARTEKSRYVRLCRERRTGKTSLERAGPLLGPFTMKSLASIPARLISPRCVIERDQREGTREMTS